MNTLTRCYRPSPDLRGTCYNPEVRPDWFPTIGEYYTHWQIIIRVTAIGCDLDAHKPLPNCIAYESVGWRSLFGGYWRFDFTRPDGGHTEMQLERCDKIYLFHWDRNGVLYGSDKGRQFQALIQQQAANVQPARGSHDSKAWETYHAEANRLTQAMEALTNSPADPERFPPLPPPRRMAPLRISAKAQTTNAWDTL